MIPFSLLLGIAIFSRAIYIGNSDTTCYNDQGSCIDISTTSCDGLLKSGYCPGPSNILCCVPNISVPERCFGSGPPLLPSSYEFTLKNQGFDGHSGALVYVPSNFAYTSPSLEVVVYIHGYNNCIANIVRSPELACNCSASTDVREGYDLIAQFEKASLELAEGDSAGTNRIFVAAEVAYDQANDSPGRWKDSGLFRAYIDELLTEHMVPIIGKYSANDVSRVRIFSHSGGYYVIGNMAIVGGMQNIYDLCLLDSLYADFDQFDQFVQSHLSQFGTSDKDYRFSSVYTLDGGTYNNNQAMIQRASGWVTTANCSEVMYVDNGDYPFMQETLQKYSLVFKYSTLTHDNIPRNLFYDFLMGAK